MKRLLYFTIPIALVSCTTTSRTTLDERGYLGLNAGYEFAATTLAGLGLKGEAAASANAKRAEVFKAVCRARRAYNLANSHLGRSDTPRCISAIGVNANVTGYDAEVLAGVKLIAELDALLPSRGN